MEPLLLFSLPALLLFAVQGSEFSVPSGLLTTIGLIAPLALRPGSLPRLPLHLLWVTAACIGRLLLFLHLRIYGWEELSTLQGGLIAAAGISGALAAAGCETPSWPGSSLVWSLLAGALVAALFPFVPALPFALGGLLWLGALLVSTSAPDKKSIPMFRGILGSCLLGIAAGFPVLDRSLASVPETSTLAIAFAATAILLRLPRLLGFGALDLLPPILAGLVLSVPQIALTPVWSVALGLGLARLLRQPHEPRTVAPAASFIIGIAISHALVSQLSAAYLIVALALAEVLRIAFEYRVSRGPGKEPRRESGQESGAAVDAPGSTFQEN